MIYSPQGVREFAFFATNEAAVGSSPTGEANLKQCKQCEKPLTNKCSKYCSNRCQHLWQRQKLIADWKAGKHTGHWNDVQLRVNEIIRQYLLGKFNHRCAKCGWDEVNPTSGKSPLQVEHIDGDASNCSEDNLTILCPNCHSLTPTYMALNKGRSTRKRF